MSIVCARFRPVTLTATGFSPRQPTIFECAPAGGQEWAVGKKLFVGNLSFETTGQDLESLFSQVGTCESATVITDRATGRSRGFGFVEMSTSAEAERAIQEFNGKPLQ